MTELQQRSDDLSEAFTELGEILRDGDRGITGGWMHPRVAWAFYWQNGVIKQWVNRMATLMTKSGWTYLNSDVPYNWARVQSDLETLKLKRAMRLASIWTFVFGGAGIYYDVDDVFNDPATPLDPDRVRKINKLVPMSAYGLYPETGKNYATATWFENRASINRQRIHRSRLGIVVAGEVPPGFGYFGDPGFINTITGWPPSMLEGVFESFCDWKGSQKDISTIIRSMSLLSLELEGLRKAAASPDSAEADELRAYLEQVAENLENDSLLTLEKGDKLLETGRTVAGLADLEEGKKFFFLAGTGAPQELILMQAVGNLGDNSGPIKAFYDAVGGMAVDMLTPVIEKTTDLDLGLHQRAGIIDNEPVEIPSAYTVEMNTIAEQSDAEKAKQRESESKARVNDAKSGVPAEVIHSDPRLADNYTDMTAYRERVAEERKVAEAVAEAEGAKPPVPEGELMPAAEIARRLGVSPTTVLKLREQGKIEGRKVGSRWRFHWPSVWEALNQSVEEAEELEEELEGQAADRLDELVALLDDAEAWTTHNMIAHPLMSLLETHGFVAEAAALHELTIPEDEPGILSNARSFATWLAMAIESTAPAGVPAPGLGLSEASSFGEIYGASTSMREVFAVLERVAPSNFPVLVTGETGTGKEGVAAGLHSTSGRKGSFVAINCAAIRGDAREEVEARAAEAAGGTLFLDEIGELDAENQASLLRVLGGGLDDVRLVSATWRDLREPDFRRDLLNRINKVHVEIPPLRDREGDVLELARRFYASYASESGWRPLESPFAPDAVAAMLGYLWPGNVRELKNAVERGALFAGMGAPITAELLQLPFAARR